MLIATVALPPEALALERTIDDLPDIAIEAEQIAAHSTAWTMPCLWVGAADFEATDETLGADPTVEEIVESYEFDEEKYYQIEWSDEVERRIDTFLDRAGSILDAEVDSWGWTVTFRFASREQFDAFREFLSGEGYGYDLLNLTEPGAPRQAGMGATPAQRDALVTAMEQGYYRIPREANLRDVASALDTSHQAVSELLRRGTENLIASILTTAEERE